MEKNNELITKENQELNEELSDEDVEAVSGAGPQITNPEGSFMKLARGDYTVDGIENRGVMQIGGN